MRKAWCDMKRLFEIGDKLKRKSDPGKEATHELRGFTYGQGEGWAKIYDLKTGELACYNWEKGYQALADIHDYWELA